MLSVLDVVKCRLGDCGLSAGHLCSGRVVFVLFRYLGLGVEGVEEEGYKI